MYETCMREWYNTVIPDMLTRRTKTIRIVQSYCNNIVSNQICDHIASEKKLFIYS